MSNYLRQLRGNRTQEEVAKAINRTKSYICDLEIGRRKGSIETLQALSKLYGCDYEALCKAQLAGKETQ